MKWRGDRVVDSRVCPIRWIRPQSYALLELFPHYRAGRLYAAGGIRDQPRKYMVAMDLLTAFLSPKSED